MADHMTCGIKHGGVVIYIHTMETPGPPLCHLVWAHLF
uniref:Uncharacterized protein n=1 Tax=Arundo donax TaxID=35708 RepID=A0A0A9HRF2_ARUDO